MELLAISLITIGYLHRGPLAIKPYFHEKITIQDS